RGLRRRAVAELPDVVVAPAAQAERLVDRAGVQAARSDGLDAAGETRDASRLVHGEVVGVAELAVAVAPPAPRGPLRVDRTGLRRAGRDRLDARSEPGDRDRDGRIVVAAVAQSAVDVRAPAPRAAPGSERTAVLLAEADGDHVGESRDRRRDVARGV